MSEQWFYNPGDWYVLDDLSGFKRRRSRCDKIPGGQTGGLIVDRKNWEPQHSQDFVRGIPDEMWVPEARPRQVDQFTVLGTLVSAYSPRGSAVITVESTADFARGYRVLIMLDIGENFRAVVVGIGDHQLRITPVLPASVGDPSLGTPIENMVLNMGPYPYGFLVDDRGDVPIVDDAGDLLGTP